METTNIMARAPLYANVKSAFCLRITTSMNLLIGLIVPRPIKNRDPST